MEPVWKIPRNCENLATADESVTRIEQTVISLKREVEEQTLTSKCSFAVKVRSTL